MPVHVTRASIADVSSALAIDPTVGIDPQRETYIAENFSSGHCWVARRESDLAGFAIMSKFFGHEFIELINVAEAERRTGVGSALMEAIEGACPGDRLFTSTNESNLPMRALCAKRGWLPAGQVDYLDPGDPEVFLVKLLPR